MADGKVVIDVILDDGQVAKGVADVDKSLGGLSGSAKKASVSIGKIATALGLVYLAKKGIDMIKDALDGAFNRIDTLEQFDRVMGVMVDNTDAVAESMDRLQGIVEGTSMRTDVMAQGIQNFVTRGMGIDKATDTVEAWGNAVAFYGDGSNEQFENVSNALQNMVAKGTVGMDQLNRIYEAGIPATEIYADATGKSVDEVSEALSNGEISAEDFVNTVSDAMMEGTEKFPEISTAMKDMGMSWGSVMDNIGAYVEIGVSNIITAIDDMLENNGLPTMREMLDDFGQAFGDTLSSIAEAIPSIVDKIMEFVEKIQEWKSVLDEVQSHFEPFRQALMNSLGNLLESFGPIWESLKNLFQSLVPILEIVGAAWMILYGINVSVASGLISAIGPVIAAVIDLGAFVVDTINLIIAVLVGDFSGALDIWNRMTETSISFFTNLWDGVVNFFSSFVETIVGFFKSLYMTLVGNSIIPDMVNAILDWITDLVDRFIDLITGLVDSVVSYFTDLYTKSVEKVKSMVTSVIDRYTEMREQAVQRAQEILTNVIQKFQEIKTNIQNRITEAKNVLVQRFTEMVSNARQKATEIATNVKNKFQEVKSNIQSRLEEAKATLVNKFTEMVTNAKNKATEIVTTARDKFEEVKGAIRDKLTEAVTTVSEKVGEMPGKVTEKVTDMISAGKDLISGLIGGIKEMKDNAVEAITGVVDGVVDKAKSLLKIKSPSRVFNEIGEFIVQGLTGGIDDNAEKGQVATERLFNRIEKVTDKSQKEINAINKKANREASKIERRAQEDINSIHRKAKQSKRKLTKDESIKIRRKEEDTAQKIKGIHSKASKDIQKIENDKSKELERIRAEEFKRSKNWIEHKRNFENASLLEELEDWERVQKRYKKGTKEREEAEMNVQRVKQDVHDKLTDLNNDYLKQIEDINQKLIDEENRLNEEYQKALDDRTKSLYSFAGIFDEIKDDYVSGWTLLDNLDDQVKTFEAWSENIKQLAERGINQGLLKELRDMGPKAAAEIRALNTLTDEELTQYSALWQQKNELAREQAAKELEGMKEDTKQKIEELRIQTEKDLSKLEYEWIVKIGEIRHGTREKFNPLISDLNGIAKNAMEGMYKGLESMEGKVISKAQQIAEAVKNAMASAFDIHSPSRWMRDMIGRNMMIGWMQGIDAERTAVIQKANESTEWMSPTPVVNRLRGVTAPIRGIMPTGAIAGGNSSITNNNSRSYAPQINNYFTRDESTPSEVARKNKQQQQRLAMEWGY